MAQTTAAMVIDPEVYADMAQARFLGAVRVAGSPAVLEDASLEGVPGSTITFPKWNTIGEMDNLTETVAMVPVAMGTDEATATIKEVGKSVEITDKSRLVSLGDPVDEAARQFGVMAARKVDADLITQAQADETAQGGSTPLAVTASAGQTTFTYARFLDGVKLFGDEWEPSDFAGLFINSAQVVEAFNEDKFISADKLGSAGLPVARGQIGAIMGVPLYVTDRVAAKKLLFLKNNSLGLLYKRRPLVETDRDILARATVVASTIHYAVKRLDDRAVGVVTLAAS
ncbi:phage major capsid protein [Yinghuangia soli]|uniref:Phage head protein n=1 Tax=Yinghuangia soli TaxID=2908204 RepID=A0AA41Q543_9ACTN|nr:phage head protein [Yinghuangia soli]MCF2531745.1 phage head protein [Yinghuangia soli]